MFLKDNVSDNDKNQELCPLCGKHKNKVAKYCLDCSQKYRREIGKRDESLYADTEQEIL